jgi:hypothetical protein
VITALQHLDGFFKIRYPKKTWLSPSKMTNFDGWIPMVVGHISQHKSKDIPIENNTQIYFTTAKKTITVILYIIPTQCQMKYL